MSFVDKARNKLDEAAGAAKEKIGQVTGNEDLEARGEADQAKADTKQAGEHVKDAAGDVRDAFGQ